jgi:hypothetical protein
MENEASRGDGPVAQISPRSEIFLFWCRRCERALPRLAFHSDRSKRSGIKKPCAECQSAAKRVWYEENRERKLAEVKARQARLKAERPPRQCAACSEPARSPLHRYCERCAVGRRTSEPQASSTARGYGRAHRKLRTHWAPIVAMGRVACARCGHLIARGEPWDLGHDDVDRSVYRGPEHAACNRATAGRVPLRVECTSRRW